MLDEQRVLPCLFIQQSPMKIRGGKVRAQSFSHIKVLLESAEFL